MNIQNLLGQIMMSNNPMQSIMGMLNPQQKNQANQLLSLPKEQKAQKIAEYCNSNGISKQQLQDIVRMFNK